MIGSPLDELHHEERLIGLRGAAVEDAGDVGVIHQGQRLTLGVEPGQHGPRIHADLDQLESDLALDGLGLIGAVNGAHPPFAEDVSERVPTRDDLAHFGSAGGRPRGATANAKSRRRIEVPRWPVPIAEALPRPVPGSGREFRVRSIRSSP